MTKRTHFLTEEGLVGDDGTNRYIIHETEKAPANKAILMKNKNKKTARRRLFEKYSHNQSGRFLTLFRLILVFRLALVVDNLVGNDHLFEVLPGRGLEHDIDHGSFENRPQ